MIILRRNTERRHIRSGKSEMWLSFYLQENTETDEKGFGTISVFNEYMLPSSEGIISELVRETELVTYMHKGALALEGPKEHSEVITAGEFQCMTIIRVLNQMVTNTSRTDLAHFFRIYLRIPPSRLRINNIETQKRYTTAQRRNVLCAVASPGTLEGSLHTISDTTIYSSILDQGQHIVHELLHGQKAWLHVVYGMVTANEVNLVEGDGMGIIDEPAISITAKENAELLLIDMLPDSSNAHQDAAC